MAIRSTMSMKACVPLARVQCSERLAIMFRLDELMTARDMTEAQLAGLLDHSQQYINRLRRTEEPNTPLSLMQAMAEVFQVPIWALFADAPPYTPNGHVPSVPPRFRIRELVARRQFRSVDKLAMLAELSPTYVRRIAGKNPPNVRLQALRAMADALQVPVWALFEHAPTYVDEKNATQQLPLPMMEA